MPDPKTVKFCSPVMTEAKNAEGEPDAPMWVALDELLNVRLKHVLLSNIKSTITLQIFFLSISTAFKYSIQPRKIGDFSKRR